MRVTENCVVCGHGPLYLNPLYDHYRRSHFWSKAQIEKEKLRIQIKTGNNRCEICNKLFSTLHSLKIHNQRKHPKGTSMKLICPECGQRFTTHLLLAAHCSDSHTSEPATQDFSIITGRFESYAAFEEWKDYLESTSLMNFTKRYAMPCKTGGQQHFFFCRYARKKTKGLSGAEESGIEEPGEKSSIPSHSKRKPAHCPAFIKVFEKEDGSVTYEGCLGHLGHGVCPSKLRLNKNDVEEILGMLREGLQADEIIAKILKERWNHSVGADRQARICYVEEKDIWRMAHRHGIIQGRYRPPKKPATVEKIKRSGPNKDVFPAGNFDYHVEEVIDLTENGNDTSEDAPMFFQTMQRVDTAAIEAFQSFQEINRFVNELMELCVRNNQYELISQMNSAMLTKANEIAGAIGVTTKLFLERIPTLTQLVTTDDLQGTPVEQLMTVSQNGHEESQRKSQQGCGSQSSLEDARREDCDVIDIKCLLDMEK